MLNYWEKFGFINIYVEHKVDTPIFEEGILLLTDGVEVEVKDATEDANVEVEGASEDAGVGVEGANVEVEGAGAWVEGATKGANVEVEGVGAGVEGVTESANVEVEGATEGVEGVTKGANVEVEGVGVGVEGAGEVMRNCKQHRKGTEVESDNENSREENDIEVEIHIETDNEGGDAEIEENTNENDSDDYNIDENESSLASSDEEEDEATLRRKKFPKYNRNSESPQFCLGMLFTDGKEFKDAIYKYSRCNRRELKIVKNEPKRISVKCIASTKCPWRIYASTNRQTRCIQVKTFINEHSCPVSFKNKMVSMKVIAEHFEDTIKDHPKMKIKEIQRRIQSELHVNVPNARCRRAKSLVTSRLAGSCKEEFALLWDYADELRTKNPGSTIKME
ncbi:hypothetical protein V6N11_067715 [Hibiscus sabdariffa]|uniref:Transposase MuDR plant domain-containing protein n=1 Tax=Hibiscus sabdariffa TaxID=183260 RepID=A0ABR2SSF8_9ROSI